MEKQRMMDAYDEVCRINFENRQQEDRKCTAAFIEGVKWADKNPFIMQDLEKAASVIERMRAAMWNDTHKKTPEGNGPFSEYCFVHVNDAGCHFFTKARFNINEQEWLFTEGGRCKKTAVDYWMYIPKLPYETR